MSPSELALDGINSVSRFVEYVVTVEPRKDALFE
jgi:hypothetical protein